MWKDHKDGYGIVSRVLHWGMAGLILPMLALSWWMDSVPKASKFMVYNTHKLIGLTLLFLVLYRVAWRCYQGVIRRTDMPRWEWVAAHAVHGLMYIMMLVMPLSGWLMATASNHLPHLWSLALPMPWVHASKHLVTIAEGVHSFAAWAWIALLAIHIGAALLHWHWDRFGVWRGMSKGSTDG